MSGCPFLFLDNFKNTKFLIYFMKVNFNLKKEYVYGIIGLLVLATGFLIVNAYNSPYNDPSIMGHSADELNLSGAVERVYNKVYVPYNSMTSVNVTCPEGKIVINCGWSHGEYANEPDYENGIFWYNTMLYNPNLKDYSWWFITARVGLNECVGEFQANYPGYYNNYYYIEAICI